MEETVSTLKSKRRVRIKFVNLERNPVFFVLKTLLFVFLISTSFATVQAAQNPEYYRRLVEEFDRQELQLAKLDSLTNTTPLSDIKNFRSYHLEYIDLATHMDLLGQASRKLFRLQQATGKQSEDFGMLPLLDQLIEKSSNHLDSLTIGKLYLNRGKLIESSAEKAIEDYNTALKYFSKTDTLLRAEAFLLRGNARIKQEKLINAYDDFNASYRLFESIGKYGLMIKSQEGITQMFSHNGFNQKAIEERERLIQIARAFNLNGLLAEQYYYQSIDYQKLGDWEKQYENLLIAEKLSTQYPTDIATLVGINSKFISYYSKTGRIFEAKKYLDQLESRSFDREKNLLIEMDYLKARIDYLIAIESPKLALMLAEERHEISKRLQDREKIMESSESLSEIHFMLKNYKESVVFHKTATGIKDSILDKSTMNALAYFQTLYETEKKEKELIEQATSFALLKKDNESFRKAILLGGVAVVLAFIVILLYRNHYFSENRRRLHELYSQRLLLSQENERKRISEDLHDGIGQQLLVIKNHLVGSDDHVAKTMLDDAIEEVRYISRDLHPFLLKELGVTKAIEKTIWKIDQNTKLFISSDIDNINNLTSKENELNIYRIVQESLSNIIKHSQADAAKLSIKKVGNAIIIKIRDNGIGFDYQEKYNDSGALGLKTMKERARFLNGTMKVISKRNEGTLLEFQISI